MADLAKIVEDLSNLTVLEAAELSKLLEEKWGVSAAAPVAVAAVAGAAAPVAEEKQNLMLFLLKVVHRKLMSLKKFVLLQDLVLKKLKIWLRVRPSLLKRVLLKMKQKKLNLSLKLLVLKLNLNKFDFIGGLLYPPIFFLLKRGKVIDAAFSNSSLAVIGMGLLLLSPHCRAK